MEDVFMPLAESGNDEAILSLRLVSVSTDDCGYTVTTQKNMVYLDCNMAGVSSASSSHIAALRQKYNCPFCVHMRTRSIGT